MNERINGLWWQARIGYNNQNCDPEVLAKFAELIVRECAKLVEDNMDPQNAWITPAYIKEHFGVEE